MSVCSGSKQWVGEGGRGAEQTGFHLFVIVAAASAAVVVMRIVVVAVVLC